MCLGKVYNVNEVADTRAVGSVVVVAKHGKAWANADGRLRKVRNEVGGHTVGKFADDAGGVGADRVEITQQDGGDRSTALDVILNDFFVNLLGVAVRAFGRFDGSLFRNR